jgi:hypothetical protein
MFEYNKFSVSNTERSVVVNLYKVVRLDKEKITIMRIRYEIVAYNTCPILPKFLVELDISP